METQLTEFATQIPRTVQMDTMLTMCPTNVNNPQTVKTYPVSTTLPKTQLKHALTNVCHQITVTHCSGFAFLFVTRLHLAKTQLDNVWRVVLIIYPLQKINWICVYQAVLHLQSVTSNKTSLTLVLSLCIVLQIDMQKIQREIVWNSVQKHPTKHTQTQFLNDVYLKVYVQIFTILMIHI